MRKFWGVLLFINLPHFWFVLLESTTKWYVVPHLCLLFAAVVLLAMITFRQSSSPALVMVTVAVLVALLATASYAFKHWPGGDDGGGIAWFVVAGGISLLSAAAGLVFLAIGMWRRQPSKGA